MSGHLNEVRADYIRYANCWEDADVLIKGLQMESGKKVLSIASAGDNSFSLLASNPELLVAVDLNQAQLHLVELKKVAIESMEREEYLSFSGFSPERNRKDQYSLLRSKLSSEARGFWDQHMDDIEDGIIHSGKFERYFRFFHKRVLPLIHSTKKVDELFVRKTQPDQESFYYTKWNRVLWRLLFKLFFGKRAMGKYGRDHAFLREVDLVVGDFIFSKAEKHLSSELCQQNYFLDYILRGSFEVGLPHYVRLENYDGIRKNINQLKLELNYADAVQASFGHFDYVNASNIFEYMSVDTFQEVGRRFGKLLNEGGSVGYWNLMVDRDLSTSLPSLFHTDDVRSNELAVIDKGFFYKRVNFSTRL